MKIIHGAEQYKAYFTLAKTRCFLQNEMVSPKVSNITKRWLVQYQTCPIFTF